MKQFFLIICFAVCCSAFCGTLIYKGTDNEKKIISEIEIASIDKNIVTFKIGKATRTIHFSKIFKYYDSDINMNLAFDDNTSDYDLTISNLQFPLNKKGITAKRTKKDNRNNKVTFEFSIHPKQRKGQSANIKYPYFYLYLLTSGGQGYGRTIHTFHYPATAKLKNSKIYNEALMLEAALSSERRIVNPRHLMQAKLENDELNKVSIDISKIGNHEIIAYYLIAWGKDDIVFTKSEIFNHSYEVSKNWHILHNSKK